MKLPLTSFPSEVAANVPVSDGRALLIRRCDVVGLLSQALLLIPKANYGLAGERGS